MKNKILALLLAIAIVASLGITAFAAGGTGGGNNPLNVTDVSANGAALEGAEIAPDAVISITFDRGMADNFETNKTLITVKCGDAGVAATVAQAEKSVYTLTMTDAAEGAYTLTVGAGVKANNGNALGSDYTVSFTVKSSAAGGGETDEEPAPALPFTDVTADNRNYEAIKYMYGKGLMDGVTDDSFCPGDAATRGEMVNVLWKLYGSADASADIRFEDIGSGSGLKKAIRWAFSQGIAAGYSDTVFGASDGVTREQAACFLYRCAAKSSTGTGAENVLGSYSDGSSVSRYAEDAMNWAVGTGLLSAKGSGKLDPQGVMTRAQLAGIVHAYSQTIAE